MTYRPPWGSLLGCLQEVPHSDSRKGPRSLQGSAVHGWQSISRGDWKEAHGPELGRPCLQSMLVTQENLLEAFTLQAGLPLALTVGYNISWLVFPHHHRTGHSPPGALVVIFPWWGGEAGTVEEAGTFLQANGRRAPNLKVL